MNTNENILIAEFMGFTHEKNLGYYDNDMLLEQTVYDQQNGNCFDELLFDQSWDWLLPTINKCRESQIFGSQRLIDNINNSLLKLDFLSTYKNVVDFINWHNQATQDIENDKLIERSRKASE